MPLLTAHVNPDRLRHNQHRHVTTHRCNFAAAASDQEFMQSVTNLSFNILQAEAPAVPAGLQALSRMTLTQHGSCIGQQGTPTDTNICHAIYMYITCNKTYPT
jgi:hypothetical protein